MKRVVPQPIVVVEVFIAKSQCPDALTQKLAQLVLDQVVEKIFSCALNS